MTNIVYLVGRLATDPTVVKDGKKKYLSFKISVHKPFKNDKGLFECDIFPVEIPFISDEKYNKYMHKCDLVGLKGYLSFHNNEMIIICEKLSFLAKKNCEDDLNEEDN